MTRLQLNNVGKHYGPGWVFRHFESRFDSGDRVAVTGYNGSGKSTLLLLIAGAVAPDEGTVMLDAGNGEIPGNMLYQHITYAAPYIDLPDAYSVSELMHLYGKFKHPLESLSGFFSESGLEAHHNKKIRELSSGMQQRLKLLLALGYHSAMVLLDEPASNLDEPGLSWYSGLLQRVDPGSILFIASNDPGRETPGCTRTVRMEEHKTGDKRSVHTNA